MKRLAVLLLLVGTVTITLNPHPAFALTAAGPGAAPGCVLKNGDVPSLGCLAVVISNVIGIMLTFVGAAALIYLLYGSILFVISRGDPKAIEKAKKTMTYAIFGVLAVFGIFIATAILSTAIGIPNPLQNFSLYVP